VFHIDDVIVLANDFKASFVLRPALCAVFLCIPFAPDNASLYNLENKSSLHPPIYSRTKQSENYPAVRVFRRLPVLCCVCPLQRVLKTQSIPPSRVPETLPGNVCVYTHPDASTPSCTDPGAALRSGLAASRKTSVVRSPCAPHHASEDCSHIGSQP
jgi:hypothetical protein